MEVYFQYRKTLISVSVLSDLQSSLNIWAVFSDSVDASQFDGCMKFLPYKMEKYRTMSPRCPQDQGIPSSRSFPRELEVFCLLLNTCLTLYARVELHFHTE